MRCGGAAEIGAGKWFLGKACGLQLWRKGFGFGSLGYKHKYQWHILRI